MRALWLILLVTACSATPARTSGPSDGRQAKASGDGVVAGHFAFAWLDQMLERGGEVLQKGDAATFADKCAQAPSFDAFNPEAIAVYDALTPIYRRLQLKGPEAVMQLVETVASTLSFSGKRGWSTAMQTKFQINVNERVEAALERSGVTMARELPLDEKCALSLSLKLAELQTVVEALQATLADPDALGALGIHRVPDDAAAQLSQLGLLALGQPFSAANDLSALEADIDAMLQDGSATNAVDDQSEWL